MQLGTRFIATTECRASEAYKQAILRAEEKDIVLSERITGVPVAVINTPFIQRMGLKAGPIARWMLRGRRRKSWMRTIYALKSLWQLKHASLDETGEKDYWQAGQSRRRDRQHRTRGRDRPSVRGGLTEDSDGKLDRAASPTAAVQGATLGGPRGHSRQPPQEPSVRAALAFAFLSPVACRPSPAHAQTSTAEEIRLARSAAPAEVSARATVLVLRDGKYVEGVKRQQRRHLLRQPEPARGHRA